LHRRHVLHRRQDRGFENPARHQKKVITDVEILHRSTLRVFCSLYCRAHAEVVRFEVQQSGPAFDELAAQDKLSQLH
jgi:hypothetical protein